MKRIDEQYNVTAFHCQPEANIKSVLHPAVPIAALPARAHTPGSPRHPPHGLQDTGIIHAAVAGDGTHVAHCGILPGGGGPSC